MAAFRGEIRRKRKRDVWVAFKILRRKYAAEDIVAQFPQTKEDARAIRKWDDQTQEWILPFRFHT